MIVRKYELGDVYHLTPQKSQIEEYVQALKDEKWLLETNTTVLIHDSIINGIFNIDEQAFSLLLSKSAKSKMTSIFKYCLKETSKQGRENFIMVVRDKFKQGDRMAKLLSFKQTGESLVENAIIYNVYQRCK